VVLGKYGVGKNAEELYPNSYPVWKTGINGNIEIPAFSSCF
jgi:hypothetical protein